MIKLSPSFLNPFEARGMLLLSVIPEHQNNTSVVLCEIISGSYNRDGFYFLIFLFVLWSMASLTIFYDSFSGLMVIIGWLLFFLVIRLTHSLNMGKLENKLDEIISTLRRSNLTAVKH